MDDKAYATVAEAEKVITGAGYTRGGTRHLWVLEGKACKVVRTDDMKFAIREV